MLTKSLLCVLVLIASAVVRADPFAKCNPTDAAPISVRIENCEEEYCKVQRGVPVTMEMTFRTEMPAENLIASVQAKIPGGWLPWPLGSQGKVCNNLSNGKCPLAAGSEATYTLSFTIPQAAPVGTRTIVRLTIAEGKTTIVCSAISVLVSA